MILILTDKNDVHVNVLTKLLKQDSIPFFRFNLDTKSLEKTKVSFSGNKWVIRTSNKTLNMDDVKVIWNRKTFVQLMLDEQDKGYEFNIWKNEWNKTLLGIYYSLKDRKWLNYYRNNHKAENKYLQMDIAEKLEFSIPPYLLSNNKKEILKFCKLNNKVVLKLMNQDFYKVSDKKFLGFYVNIVKADDFKDFAENEENPIFLQKYIEKQYEVRYTVVGEEHFVCRIDSQKSKVASTDWRKYDISNTPHSQIQPPKELKEKVCRLMKELNLTYGALDFIVDNDNNWWFLEVNPSGQYLWIEDLTGMPITNSIKNNLLNTLN